jgi:hypothetical protein
MSNRVEKLTCLLATASLLTGCSTTLGLASAHTISDKNADDHVGFTTLGLLELPLLDTDANLTLGVSTSVLERTSPKSSAWGDWRFGGLVGFSQTPRPNELRLGYEAFLSAGLARYQSVAGPRVGSSFGLQLGAPLRLSRQRPAWRSDELIAVNFYLVPSVAVHHLGFDRTEVVLGAALRGSFWSSTIP